MVETKKTKGTVTEKTARKTSAGEATDLTVNGLVFSTFKPGNVKVGDIIELEYVENGKYNNVKAITAVVGQTTLQISSPTPVLPAATKSPITGMEAGHALNCVSTYWYGRQMTDKEMIDEAVRFIKLHRRLVQLSV